MDSPKESDEEKYYRSLREYSRVDGFLPVQIRVVEEEMRFSIRSRTSVESALTEHPEMPEPEDRLVAECLRILNSKLDTIIRMLAFQTRDYMSLKIEQINISAGGLSTFVDEAVPLGAVVEIRLVLPNSPYMVFYIYGNVVKCEQASDRFAVSIGFTEIDEDIREQIAKFVFERQREILRKKRRP